MVTVAIAPTATRIAFTTGLVSSPITPSTTPLVRSTAWSHSVASQLAAIVTSVANFPGADSTADIRGDGARIELQRTEHGAQDCVDEPGDEAARQTDLRTRCPTLDPGTQPGRNRRRRRRLAVTNGRRVRREVFDGVGHEHRQHCAGKHQLRRVGPVLVAEEPV